MANYDIKKTRVLLLGGTTEASELAGLLANDQQFAATLSLAGRTQAPMASVLPSRTGGFGGVEGLSEYLRDERIDIVVDATHPFAAQISSNAALACADAGVPLIAVERPAWAPVESDNWVNTDSIADGVAALGSVPRRVFCAIGRLYLGALHCAPQHHYIIRLIDKPGGDLGLPHATIISARGPFDTSADVALFREHGIEVVLAKNSGGIAAISKIEAARELGLPVIMVTRPQLPLRETVSSAPEAWQKLVHHRSSSERGV